MGDYLSVLTATLVFAGVFSFILVYMDIESVKQNWDVRRCELPVMVAAGLYKPAYYTKSATDFATENFNYCGRKIADDVIRIGMAPYYAIAQQQIKSQGAAAGPMNNMRGALSKAKNQFSDYLEIQYKKYQSIIAEVRKLYTHFKFAIGRVQAIVYTLIYTMIAMFKTVMNTMKFTIGALKIFLGILMALMIILFFVVSPFMAIVLGVTIAITAAGLAAADGMDDAMCCDPEAQVRMADGSTKRLGSIQIGDILLSTNSQEPNRVEGILLADGNKTKLVSIKGVKMSQSHSVYYKTSWLLAKDHPDAVHLPSIESLPTLICLNTTLHEVPLVGFKEILVSDWEEVSSLQGQVAWIDWVNLNLNGPYLEVRRYPTTVPLVSETIQVISETRGSIPISSIVLGERIQSKNGFTAVKAIYHGCIQGKAESPEWISDGVWMKHTLVADWKLVQGLKKDQSSCRHTFGIYLITEDGDFILEYAGEQRLVRDFTEIGLEKLDQSYEMIQTFMNKK
jgi:hypothetical protein